MGLPFFTPVLSCTKTSVNVTKVNRPDAIQRPLPSSFLLTEKGKLVLTTKDSFPIWGSPNGPLHPSEQELLPFISVHLIAKIQRGADDKDPRSKNALSWHCPSTKRPFKTIHQWELPPHPQTRSFLPQIPHFGYSLDKNH